MPGNFILLVDLITNKQAGHQFKEMEDLKHLEYLS
jgi:hypothetical protein